VTYDCMADHTPRPRLISRTAATMYRFEHCRGEKRGVEV
jgi:hypothetical protein